MLMSQGCDRISDQFLEAQLCLYIVHCTVYKCTLTRDHEDLGLDVESAGDHEEAARVGVEPPRGRVQAPALAST